MHGKRRQALHTPWLETLKVAIIEEQHETIMMLTQEIPKLSPEEAVAAQNLIQETITLFSQKKLSIQETMQKIKKNSAFLAQEKQNTRLSTLS